jgi:hypothetical protein
LVLLAAEQTFLAGALLSYLWWQRRQQKKESGTPLRLHSWIPIACYVILISVVILFVCRHAIGVDESAMLFQAKTFRTGSLTVSAPPESEGLYRAEFHFHQHAMYRGRWFSQYPAGWPAVIAAAMTVGAETLLNPSLALLYLILLYRLAGEVFGNNTAVLAVSVLATAPAFLYLSSGFLTHISCAVLVFGSFYCTFRARQPNAVLPLIGAVVCLAGAAMIRQYTAFLAGLVIGPLAIAAAWPSRKRLLALVGAIAACAAMLGSWNYYYNKMLMGDPTASPYSYNFPHLFSWSPGHIMDRLINSTRWSLQGTMMYVFVLMAPLILVCLAWERKQRMFVWSLAALFGILVLGHVPFELGSGEYFWRPTSSGSLTIGERYYSEAYFAAAILTGRGLELLFEYFKATRRAVVICLAVLGAAQCVHLGIFMQKTRERNNFAVALQEFILADHATDAVIFGPPYFGDINFNGPDWQSAPKFYMLDPAESKREGLVRVLGRKNWVVVNYDDDRKIVTAKRYSLEPKGTAQGL